MTKQTFGTAQRRHRERVRLSVTIVDKINAAIERSEMNMGRPVKGFCERCRCYVTGYDVMVCGYYHTSNSCPQRPPKYNNTSTLARAK